MSTDATDSRSGGTQNSQLVLEIWHPDCWTLETTAAADAGLVATGVFVIDDIVHARVTAYADTGEAVADLVDRIDASEHTESVQTVTRSFGPRAGETVSGNATEHLLVKYAESNSIHDALVSRGFVPVESIRIQDGREYWTVVGEGPRSELAESLREIEREMSADIEVMSTGPTRPKDWEAVLVDDLSERQREVLELARHRGYYEWPRETNASDLADHLGVSKTTLLEHLRKAESKVMSRY